MIRVEKTDCDTRYESQSPLQNYQQSAQIMKHCAQALSLPTHSQDGTWSTLNAAVLMGNFYKLKYLNNDTNNESHNITINETMQ